MARNEARIGVIRFFADGAPVVLDFLRFFSAVVAPAPGRAFARERNGPILSQEPVVRVVAIVLANNLGLQFGWKFAGRISSVAENGTLRCLLGDGSLILPKESLGVLQEWDWNIVDHILHKLCVHCS